MGKLIIPCMDGASASFRRRHIRTYMSDVVKESIFNVYKGHPHDMDKAIRFHSERGSAIFSKKRQIKNWILDHNESDNSLLCVGKSYGAYNMVEILEEISDELKYLEVRLILVDMASVKKILRREIFYFMPAIKKLSQVYSYRQSNQKLLNGYLIVSPHNNLVEAEDLTDKTVNGWPVNHWNIVDHPFVKNAIKTCIKEMTGKK